MALSGFSSGGGIVRPSRASSPVIDRRTAFAPTAPRRTPPKESARPVKSYRGKISAVVLVTVMFGSFMGILFSYSGHVSSYSDHLPITITGDTDFTVANGVVSGDGSITNPYVISNWRIDSDFYGISVSDTTAYFVISDVFIECTFDWAVWSIYFENVRHAAVVSSSFMNTTVGVQIVSSNNLTIDSCQFADAETGVSMWVADNVTVSNCSIDDGPYMMGFNGIFIEHGKFCVIDNNTISNMYYDGLYSWDSHDMMYSSNNVSNNDWNGFSLLYESNSVVFNNTMCFNLLSGVNLDTCSNMVVYGNSFFSNTPSQAYDWLGTYNAWDAGPILGGNYWSDYTGTDGGDADLFGDDPYPVDGDSSSADGYPLMTPPGQAEVPIPEFSTVVVPVVALMALFLLVRRRRSGL